jgi:hypothetical protein
VLIDLKKMRWAEYHTINLNVKTKGKGYRVWNGVCYNRQMFKENVKRFSWWRAAGILLDESTVLERQLLRRQN